MSLWGNPKKGVSGVSLTCYKHEPYVFRSLSVNVVRWLCSCRTPQEGVLLSPHPLRQPQTYLISLSLVSWKILLLYCPQPDKGGACMALWQEQLSAVSMIEPRITGLWRGGRPEQLEGKRSQLQRKIDGKQATVGHFAITGAADRSCGLLHNFCISVFNRKQRLLLQHWKSDISRESLKSPNYANNNYFALCLDMERLNRVSEGVREEGQGWRGWDCWNE